MNKLFVFWMKKKFIFTSIVFFTPLFLGARNNQNDSSKFAQKFKWQVDAFFGQSIGKQKTLFGTEATRIDSTEYNSKALFGSYGAGLLYGIRFNCFITENIGFSFGLHHLQGNIQSSAVLNDPIKNIYYKGTQAGNYTGINADIVFKTSGKGHIQLEARLGAVIVPWSTVYEKLNYFPPTSVLQTRENKTVNRLGKGFANSIGASYKLSKHFSIGLDIRSTLLNATGETRTLTKYTINGVDKLEDENLYSKKINYVDAINSTSNVDTNPGYSVKKPHDALAPVFSFSSFVGFIKVTVIF